MMMKYFWLLVCGFLGGYLGRKLKIPGGVLIGSMLFTVLGNLFFINVAYLPDAYSFGLQVMVGAMVGHQISKKMLLNVKSIIVPVIMSSFLLLFFSLIFMTLLHFIFNWDFETAWLSSAPGRMVDMVIISGTVGADSTRVLVTHIIRHFMVILSTPFVLLIANKLQLKRNKKQSGEKMKEGAG